MEETSTIFDVLMIELLSEIKGSLEYMLKKIKEESENGGFFLNIKKTVVMVFARKGNIKIEMDGEEKECVEKLTFLAST